MVGTGIYQKSGFTKEVSSLIGEERNEGLDTAQYAGIGSRGLCKIGRGVRVLASIRPLCPCEKFLPRP